jgi:hypothetical protein
LSSKQSLTRLPAHPETHENVLSFDFQVSGSVLESASKFCRIDPDCDTDSDPEVFWHHFLFSEQVGGKVGGF